MFSDRGRREPGGAEGFHHRGGDPATRRETGPPNFERLRPVRLITDLRTDIAGKHVLIVEDIVDTGDTLDYLMHLLALRGPASLKCCALLSKPACRKTDVRIDYLGFEIPDVWVVGYGLDDLERYRVLPYIGIRSDEPAV